ncbi:MAG: hypothetical protein ACKOEG_10760 [Chthoniobacterales bacterium]
MALLRIAILSLVLAAAARAVEIRFVPAIPEGTVSLGIYDQSGKLVRLLCDEWPVDRFTAGLNGLSTEWDGKDATGQPVPAGIYRARGFVMGDVRIEGEAIHFNDWIDSDNAPRIVSVGSIALLEGGDLLLAARLVGDTGALLRYSPRSAAPWQTLATEKIPDAVGRVKIASASGRIFLLVEGKLRALDAASGKEVPAPPLDGQLLDMAAYGNRLALLTGDKLIIVDSGDFSRQTERQLPSIRATGVALLKGDAAVVSGEDGSLWHGGEKWSRIDLPDGAKVLSVAAGRDGTFWTLEQNGTAPPVVAQYSAEEGRLAEWISGASATPIALSASPAEDYFAAVFDGSGVQRTVAIRRGAGGGWELVTDKTITASQSFGLSEGKLVPSSPDLPAGTALSLAENPLDPSAPRTLVVRASAFEGGTGLVTTDGLPLVRVSAEPGFARFMAVPGFTPDALKFYQGDGACVEQYDIANLGKIAAFDAGTIEMEGGTEKVPPPEEEVPEPSP